MRARFPALTLLLGISLDWKWQVAAALPSDLYSSAGRPPFIGIHISGGAIAAAAAVAAQATDSTGGLRLASEVAAPLSQASELDEVVDAPLLRDIKMLSDMLGEVVQREDPLAYELYQQFRKHGLDRASDVDNTEALEKMIAVAGEISSRDARSVMRIFSIILNLVNSAEVAHRLRVTRDHANKPSLSFYNLPASYKSTD